VKKKYDISDIEGDRYNYVRMLPDENSYVCNFSIPLKDKKINGCVRMIPRGDGSFWLKLCDVTEKV
jgi:hypothetical protein